ncbi:C-type mannose receptor 2-like isoform X1 [Oculina patagonica]
MKWIALFWLPFVTGCRMAKFVKEEDAVLQNHVIATVSASDPAKCRWDCAYTAMCFSINVRKLPTGRVTCELNNSSKTTDPQDLISSAGSQYHQMAEVEHCTAEYCIYKDVLPDGWYRFGPKLLKLFPERRTWEQARNSCLSIGGDLVSINHELENEFISHLLEETETNTTVKEPNQTIRHWILDGTDSDVSLFNGARYEKEDGLRSLYLHGSGAHATTPAVDFGQTSLTMASWVKLQSPANHPSTIYGYWKAPNHFLFCAYVNTELRFRVKNNKGGDEPLVKQGSPPKDKWFHAAAVWDRNANKAYLFLDGKKVGTQAVASDIYFRDDSYSFYDIGLKRDGNDSLRGYLRDLMIIRRALTGEELTSMADPFGGVWIGLNDVTTEGTYRWPDGSHVTYTKWSYNLPDDQNGYQDCVRMTVDEGAWDDTSCAKQLPFVCEKKT